MTTNLRAADLRFLLPRAPRSVALLGAAAPARDAWEAVGVPVTASGADVVVGDAADVFPALRDGPAMLLLHGNASRRGLAAAGYRSSRVLALPDPRAPRLLIPLESREAVRGALAVVGRRPATASTAARAGALALLERGLAPSRRVVTVAARRPPRPWLLPLAAGESPTPPAWYLWLGTGDPLQRAVLHHVQPSGGRTVKFSRVPRSAATFVREQARTRAAAQVPGPAARHVPVPLGCGTDAGLPYSVETRFAGRPLTEVLLSRRSQARKLEHVEAVAGWLHDLAAATRTAPRALTPERDRLARDVLPHWPGVSEDLVAAVTDLPGVLVHNDVGTWNAVVDHHDGFGVVDWESARDPGLPLWDLTYFLADALTLIEHGTFDGRTAAMLDLFGGRSRFSGVLFGHVRRAVETLGLRAAAVAPAVTLGWLHHGLSAQRRADSLDAVAGGAPPDRLGPIAGLAGGWLRDPDLGTGWSAWR